MRVYFLSYIPAALKLNGLYLGGVDNFERHVELELKDRVLAEIIPENNLQTVNFFIDDKLLSSPPPFMDVYKMDGDALVYIREYAQKEVRLDVLAQTRFNGNLVTVFTQGGVYVTVEGDGFELITLPSSVRGVIIEEKKIGGISALAITFGGFLLLISEKGKKVFFGEVESAEFGDTLKVTMNFETCTNAYAECEYSYDGGGLNLIRSETKERVPPDEKVLHFAFFESFLTRGDYKKYLSDELVQKADMLKSFFGNFEGVAVPPEKFYLTHSAPLAAGLVYRRLKNLYEIKYFAVEIENGKITNISEVE